MTEQNTRSRLQRLVAALELLFELAPLLQQGTAKLPQLVTSRVSPHRAVVPLEQHAAGLLFQSLDGAAQGGGLTAMASALLPKWRVGEVGETVRDCEGPSFIPAALSGALQQHDGSAAGDCGKSHFNSCNVLFRYISSGNKCPAL